MTATDKEAVELDFLKGIASDVKEIIVWVLKSAASNPLMGFIGAVIIVDMMHQQRLISDAAYVMVMVTLGLFDAAAAAQVFQQITGGSVQGSALWGMINASATKQGPTFDIWQPTATTVTYADSVALPSGDMTPLAAQNNIKAILGMLQKRLPPGGETGIVPA